MKEIKNFYYAAEHENGNFCDFMKDIKSDDKKFNQLADILINKINLIKNDIDFIVSVPKFKDETDETDWSLKLAEMISNKTGIAYLKNAVIKNKKTRKLRMLPSEQRQKEIENAFEIEDSKIFQDKNILIVDDVFSSGNTVKELIKTIKTSSETKNVSVAALVVCRP